MLYLRLAAASVRFGCDRPEMAEYARHHLRPSLVDETSGTMVVSRLRWHEGHAPKDVVAAYAPGARLERLDRDLYAGEGRLIWARVDDLRNLHLRFEWDGAVLRVEGDYYHHLSSNPKVDRVRRILYRRRLEFLRRRRFTTLLYYLVYYPAFWWLEHTGKAHPIHAAGVDLADGAVVLAGPSGIGKSTLSVALTSLPGAGFLGDTFLLHQGRHIWPVPEPVLLDRWSRQWLGNATAAFFLVPEKEYVLDRQGYVAPPERVRSTAAASVVVLPRRAPERYVRRLPAEEAAWRIDAYDDIVNDLRRYRAVASVLELLDPVGLGRRRLQSLEALVAAVPSYEVGLTPAMTREEAVGCLSTLDRNSNGSPSGELRSHCV